MNCVEVFTAHDVLRFIRFLCPSAKFDAVTSLPGAHLEGRAAGFFAGKKTEFILVAHERWPFTLGLRSILRVKNPRKRYSYLINGQAGKNTQEVYFEGEEGPCLVAPRAAVESALEARFSKGSVHFGSVLDSWRRAAGRFADSAESVVVVDMGCKEEKVVALPP